MLLVGVQHHNLSIMCASPNLKSSTLWRSKVVGVGQHLYISLLANDDSRVGGKGSLEVSSPVSHSEKDCPQQ